MIRIRSIKKIWKTWELEVDLKLRKIVKNIRFFREKNSNITPFELVRRKKKAKVYVIQESRNSVLQPADSEVFLHPSGLLIWFWAFSLIPSVGIFISTLGLFTNKPLLVVGWIISHNLIVWAIYFFIYYKENKPVLLGLWKRWPKSYENLINDLFTENKIPISYLHQGIRDRRKVALSVAMRNLFPTENDKNFLNLGAYNFVKFWLTPLWASYISLLITLILLFISFQVSGVTSSYVIEPRNFLVPLISWWLLALWFMYKQSEFMKTKNWCYTEFQISKHPASLHIYLRRMNNFYKPQMSLPKILNWIQIMAFGIYLVLLLFFNTAWSIEKVSNEKCAVQPCEIKNECQK